MNKILLLMSLLSLFGCGHRPAPAPVSGPSDTERRLVKLEYGGTHGYHAYSNIDYTAERTDDGKTCITLVVGNDRDRVFVEEGTVMDSLETIVLKYKMYKYDGSYTPKFDILDGDTWHFYLTFSDGKHSSCSGYEAYPPGKGAEAIGTIEGFLSRWLNREPAEEVGLTSFRYELHSDEGDEVFRFKKGETKSTVYFRNMGSLEGWNYACGDPELAVSLARILRWNHLASYTGEDLSKEDTSRPRWIVIAEFENGQKIEAMDYLDRPAEDDGWQRKDVPSVSERGLRYDAEEFFKREIERIGQLPPEELGEHRCTTYDAKGNPQRTIRYGGDGTVLGGRDYSDPMQDF